MSVGGIFFVVMRYLTHGVFTFQRSTISALTNTNSRSPRMHAATKKGTLEVHADVYAGIACNDARHAGKAGD